MTAADVIRMLLEMDQQFVSGRPSTMARAAEIVQALCIHAQGSAPTGLLGDYQSIDLGPVRAKRVSGELWQPVMDLAAENEKLRDDLDHFRTLVEILEVRPKTIAHRPGGRWDVFDDSTEAMEFEADAKHAGERMEMWNVSQWNIHSAPGQRKANKS